MNELFFERQIARLEDQWRAAYGAERKAILWRCFRGVADEEFQEAVSECLATQRSFPLLKELNEACQVARTRSSERRAQAAADRMLTASNMSELADATATEATRDFARACVGFLAKKDTYTPEQWEQACDLLEKTAEGISGVCAKCMNGYVSLETTPGYKFLYRCRCSAGRALPPEMVGVRKDGVADIMSIPLAPLKQAAEVRTPGGSQE